MTVQRQYVLPGTTDFMLEMGQRRSVIKPGSKVIVALHGRGGTCSQFVSALNWGLGMQCEELTQRGFVVLGFDAGGTTVWSNAAAMTAFDNLRTWLEAKGVEECALMGWSMGGLTALNVLKRNQDFVRGTLLWAAAANLGTAHGNATWTAEIDTAYGGDFATNSVGHDPNLERETYEAIAQAIPIRSVHSDDDTSIPLANVEPFYAACPSIDLEVVTGWGHQPFYPYPIPATREFYRALDWQQS